MRNQSHGMELAVQCHPEDREWTQNRKFEPSLRYGDGIDLNLIQVPSDNGDWTHVACDDDDPCSNCKRIEAHVDSIFIAVDGACRGNGQANAKAAIGVFFGQTSKYNRSVLLSEPHVTNQIAELRAGILALELARNIPRTKALGDGGPLHTVVIKADSEYLVKGMTEWVFKWETNGYKSANRKPVKNSKLFQELHALVKDLNTSNVEVLFWQVPREMNKEADRLANEAF
jgi:ribonuclease HI